jgi:hypothetical protein
LLHQVGNALLEVLVVLLELLVGCLGGVPLLGGLVARLDEGCVLSSQLIALLGKLAVVGDQKVAAFDNSRFMLGDVLLLELEGSDALDEAKILLLEASLFALELVALGAKVICALLQKPKLGRVR